MDPEPGEIVFFDGHPSWLSLSGLLGRGLFLAVAAGVAGGAGHRDSDGLVQILWVVVVVVAASCSCWPRPGPADPDDLCDHQPAVDDRDGILSRQLRQTRLERVQNVNASQSLGERVLRIGTVDFDTAGEADYDFAFRGVSDPRGIVRTVDRALHELRGVPPGPQDAGGV